MRPFVLLNLGRCCSKIDKIWMQQKSRVMLFLPFLLKLKLESHAGKTLAENLEQVPDLQAGQKLIFPVDRPIKSSGHIQIMYGNLAPEGCVGKITGKEGLDFEGPARVFDDEEAMLKAVDAGPQTFKVCSHNVLCDDVITDIHSVLTDAFP